MTFTRKTFDNSSKNILFDDIVFVFVPFLNYLYDPYLNFLDG